MSQSSFQPGSLRLVVEGQVQTDACFPLPTDAATILGRDPDCDLPLEGHNQVSRRHAAICRRSVDQWIIEDLGSSNGTYVNGEAIQGARVLQGGDRIQLAREGPEFQFESDAGFSPTPSAPTPVSSFQELQKTIDESDYWIEISPTRLVIQRKHILVSSILSVVLGGFFLSLLTSLFLPFLAPLAPFGVMALAVLWSQDSAYTFDLESEQFTISRVTLVGGLLNRRQQQQRYPLRELVAVRLQRSEYDDNSATYVVFLDRSMGQPIQLNLGWRQRWRWRSRPTGADPKAEAMVEIIQRFLTHS